MRSRITFRRRRHSSFRTFEFEQSIAGQRSGRVNAVQSTYHEDRILLEQLLPPTASESMMESLDEVFALFSKERRRFALYYLDQTDGPVSIEELVEQIHEWETAEPHDSVPAETFKEIVLSLEHNHLPQIENATHIEYDREDRHVRISDFTAGVDVLLSVSKSLEQPSNARDISLESNQ